ncbi:dihydropyrimidinase [Delphinella strobiligena]|nr:dihydropyrimidinase [Delphinella strobiligena]
MEFDLVVRNGLIVTASEVLPLGLEIGVKDGKIACLGTSLSTTRTTKIIDAEGAYITPGGIDSHVHLAQANSPTGDGFETGTRSAIAGGTTTIIAFVTQEREEVSLFPALKDYHTKAEGVASCDYGFHYILTNPTREILRDELPVLARKEGITSVKLYMTYDPMKLNDRELLNIMMACRSLGMTTMIHAENSDMIALIIEGLEANGNTDPFFHAIARPRIAEDEASYRAISLSELVDTPILIVHMSSETAMKHVRNAQTRLLPVHAETCPHYLYLLSEELKGKPHDHFSGAKHVCSPPLRHHPQDLEALWQGIANGTFTVLSSDHAPSKYDHPGGKKLGFVNGIPRFANIPNGLPGLETRMPLLFSESEGCLPPDEARIGLPRFVQLTSTNAAKMYGLAGRKGSIAPGYDADIVIWHPGNRGETVISQDILHHGVDYTPFEGLRVRNWPRYTILRGQVVWNKDDGGVVGKADYGQYLKRGPGQVIVGRTGQKAHGMLENERQYWMQ